MNTAMSTPLIAADTELISSGFTHDKLGFTACGPALPVATFTRATIENKTRVTSSAPSKPTWVRAESSMPITQIAVITTIHATPTAVTATVEAAAPCQPNSKNVYKPAI